MDWLKYCKYYNVSIVRQIALKAMSVILFTAVTVVIVTVWTQPST